MRPLMVLLGLALAGCGAQPVTMTNPKDGVTHLCASEALDPILASREVNQCVGIMEAMGWRSH